MYSGLFSKHVSHVTKFAELYSQVNTVRPASFLVTFACLLFLESK